MRANGNSLGELGSRIVCETIIGQLFNDPESYLQVAGSGIRARALSCPTPAAIQKTAI